MVKLSAKKLEELFEAMDSSGQQALLDYAEFLHEKYKKPLEVPSQVPLNIERPPQESVIASIRRLRNTYPMLDTDNLLNETSSYVMQHMMQGRPAVEVIDDLEVYFASQYEMFLQESQDVSDS